MADVSSSIVDEAPISPVKNTERRQSLEHFFVTRPERSELVESVYTCAVTRLEAMTCLKAGSFRRLPFPAEPFQ